MGITALWDKTETTRSDEVTGVVQTDRARFHAESGTLSIHWLRASLEVPNPRVTVHLRACPSAASRPLAPRTTYPGPRSSRGSASAPRQS